MGKLALDHLAHYISKQIKESKDYRTLESDYKTHRFNLTAEDLFTEMSKELAEVKRFAKINNKKPSLSQFDSELMRICKDAAPKIIDAVKTSSKVYRIIPIDENTIEIYSTKSGQNVFNFLRTRYRSAFNKEVQDIIVKELFGNFSSTRNYKALMRQSFEDYEASKNGTAYQQRIHALNRAVYGTPRASEKSGKKVIEYVRNTKNEILLFGGGVNLGHINSVAEQRVTNILGDISNQLEKIDTPHMGVLTSYFRDMPDIVVDILKEIKIRRNAIVNQSIDVVITTLHSATENQEIGRTEEKQIIQKLKPTIMRNLKKHDWANQPGSDSYMEALESLLVNTSIETLTKGKRGKLRKGTKRRIDATPNKGSFTNKGSLKKPSSTIKGKGSGKKVRAPQDNSQKSSRTPNKVQNWSSLLPILNAKLTPRVIANMRYPSLVNRTGTFASSAKVINIEQTREGFPTFVFDYERDPYNVFDKTQGRAPWNTPERDPRALVDKSLREVLKEMAIGRFYTRRV